MENSNEELKTGAVENDTEGKTFTQEEVNKIVQERLARNKGKESNLAEKEKELQAREMALTTRELLSSYKMDNRLADVITGETKEDIENKIKILEQVYGNSTKKKEPENAGFQVIGSSGKRGTGSYDAIGVAMGLRK